ncbi:MAG: 50S ribosomal protein L1 [Brevinemataceae bacterium]
MANIIHNGIRYKGTKRQLDNIKKYDRRALFSVDNSVEIVKELANAKFDETIEIHYNLNIKQKHSIRDTLVMPHNIGKEVKVLVFAEGEHAVEAKKAGADFIGADDLIQKIKDGWFEFDAVVATPDMMPRLAVVAAGLGRRKLMPSPKTGNVTLEIEKVVKEFKAGKVEIRGDKTGNFHIVVGKKSHPSQNLVENIVAVHNLIMKNKPSDLKGEYIKTLAIASTMSSSVRIDHKKIAG